MAKSNKERKKLKEKARIEEEKRKKRKFIIAKLVLFGVYVLSLLAFAIKNLDNDSFSFLIFFLVFFSIPVFFMMIYGTKRHIYRPWSGATFSFSEIAVIFFVVFAALNFILLFLL